MLLTPAQIKPKSFESRRNFFKFLPGVDAPHGYVRAWALGCFCSLIKYPDLSEGADHVGGQLRGDRVPLQWRNKIWQSLEEGAGKRCPECGRNPLFVPSQISVLVTSQCGTTIIIALNSTSPVQSSGAV